MCSRFELDIPACEIVARFDLRMPPPNLPGPVVRPTDPALVITANGPRILRFGVKVAWDKKPLINARLESLGERSVFRRMSADRCLVPATAWIEWQAAEGRGRKPMWRFRPAADGVFTLAALIGDEAFVILTCPAARSIAAIHPRMPVILSGEQEQAWLDGRRTPAELRIEPFAGELAAERADAAPSPATLDLFG